MPPAFPLDRPRHPGPPADLAHDVDHAGDRAADRELAAPVHRDPPPLPLSTDRLVLRPYTETDAARTATIYGRDDVARYLLEPPWTAEQAAIKVRERMSRTGLDGPARALAVVIDRDGELIGDIALWPTEDNARIGEIGWVLDPAHGGHGYAAEAVRAVLDVAFTGYDLHRVIARMDARNTASARLAASVGMQREAHLRQDWWSKGEWTDTAVYGVLSTDDRHSGPAG